MLVICDDRENVLGLVTRHDLLRAQMAYGDTAPLDSTGRIDLSSFDSGVIDGPLKSPNPPHMREEAL